MQLAIGGGFAGYQGDLQDKQILINTNDLGFGISLKYQMLPRIGIRAGIFSAKISAHDKNNTPKLRSRNLSFATWINEANLMLEYSFLKTTQSRLSPYIFGGIAVFRFNPYAFDPSGNKVYLRPLSTEGQGFPEYPHKKPYGLVQISVPGGGGVRLKVNAFMDLNFESGYRRLFTDYLDDVSGDYIDPIILQQRKGPLALKMAFRTDELPNTSATYPGKDFPRGKSRYKDWYSFYTASINFHISDFLNQARETRSSQCPRFK